MKTKSYQLILLAIILVGFLIRLRGFSLHYTLSSDSARDVLVAIGAVTASHLPWVGSFSSAGPFVFGPNWYWWLMFWKILFPNFFLAPWVGMLLVSLVYILVMYFVGKVAVGKRFGLILALFTAVTPQVVSLSAYLTQHAMVEIFSGLTLLGLVAYIRYQRPIFALLTALGVGGALAMHYQALSLIVYLPVLFIQKRPKLSNLTALVGVIIVGLFFFLWPLLIWDASRNFNNLRELIYYFQVGQYSFWTSNRWLTYVGIFWPEYLGKFLGGEKVLTYLFILSGTYVLILNIFTKKLSRIIFWPLLIFFAQFVILRYFRGEKYDGYLVYLHSIIVFFVSWIILGLIRIKQLLGVFAFLLVLFFSMKMNMTILDWNNDGRELSKMIAPLTKYYPESSFDVFVRGLSSSNCGYSFSTLAERVNRGSNKKITVGICQNGPSNCGQEEATMVNQVQFQNTPCTLVDLSSVSEDRLTKRNDWYNFSAPAVYDDVQNWWRQNQ